MKTIREIAEEIGVSKQAVYKRYKGKLYEFILPFARLVDGTIYIMEQGESIIKQDFLDSSAYMEYASDALILMLRAELESKNRQITELTDVIKTLTKGSSELGKSSPKKRKKHVNQTKKSIPVERLISKK